LLKHLLGPVLATAETSVIDPSGFFFAAMPNERTRQETAGKKKLEDVSARKTRPKPAAAMIVSGEIYPKGSMGADGVFPIITLLQVCHIEITGGYSRLLAMSILEGQELVTKGIVLHTKWEGPEPYFTQADARKGYLMAKYEGLLGVPDAITTSQT
jgi:hypothetical protein